MDTIAKLVALTILYFFFSTIVPGQITAPKDLSSSEFRAENISGGWRLNETESDELLETLESLFQKVNVKISNKSVGETEGLISPPITFSLNAPKLLVITTGSDNNSITISEGLKKSISTRTFTDDGQKRSIKIAEGIAAIVSAIRIGDYIKIETTSGRNNRMIETYVICANDAKLTATFRFEDDAGNEIFSLNRVYDRIQPDPFLIAPVDIQ